LINPVDAHFNPAGINDRKIKWATECTQVGVCGIVLLAVSF
tara:strand:+ start:1394 stop:1516 length:123 start_codon:yes stop_codon:yes gene_type:complete